MSVSPSTTAELPLPAQPSVSRLADLQTVLGQAAVVTVPGDADAISLELPDDAALLAAIIACRR